MLIKRNHRLMGLKIDKSVSRVKHWNESFLCDITDKWVTVIAEDVFSPSTVVNIEDVFIHAHPDTLKTRTSRNPMADWVRIVSCDRERFIEKIGTGLL